MAKKTYAEISDELEHMRSEGYKHANEGDFLKYTRLLFDEAKLLMKLEEKEHDLVAIDLLLNVNYLMANDPNDCGFLKGNEFSIENHWPYFRYQERQKPDTLLGGRPGDLLFGSTDLLFELADKHNVSTEKLKEDFFATARKNIERFNTPRSEDSAWEFVQYILNVINRNKGGSNL